MVATAPATIDSASSVQLADGRILFVGGLNGNTASAATYLFDPTTNVFEPLPDAPTARNGATAIQLHDGRVLVFGGRATCCISSPTDTEVETFDPTTREWDRLGARTLANPESYGDQAAVLPDGQVLALTNGVPGGSTPMLYDPSTDSWTSTGQLHLANRSVFSMVQLHDGRVFVYGGSSGGSFVGAPEIYDPTTGQWDEGAATTDTRGSAGAVVLDDGRVLIIGGYTTVGQSNPTIGTTMIYDPNTNAWQASSPLNSPRLDPAAAVRTDGSVVVAAGQVSDLGTAFPRRTSESRSPNGVRSREVPTHGDHLGGRMFALDDNSVIVIGGGSASVERLS